MKLTIIDSFAALPLGTYLDILAVNADGDRDEVDRQAATLALLTGASERDILNLPIAEYSELAAAARFLGEQPAIPQRIASSYVCGSFRLKPTADLRKVTAAQYIDFQTFAPEGEARFVELLSVFLVPEGKAYNDGYDVLEVQAAIRADLPVLDALALSAFFLRRFARSMRATETSLYRLAKRERNPKRRAKMEAMLADLQAAKASLITGAGFGT